MKLLRTLALAALTPLTSVAAACAAEHLPTPASDAPALDPAHRLLASVLARVVTPDGVDYRALVADHADLDAYRAQLARAPVPAERAARIAHLVNAYNAFTLALVVHLLPADRAGWPRWSIKDGARGLASVWKRFSFDLGGERVSLDAIEHERLRPLGEPRIHVAINCASRSCPPLSEQPTTAATLDADLARATRAFLADPGQLRLAGERVVTNPILDWFAEDFRAAGGVRAFLLAHLPEGPIAAALRRDAAISFFDYDWRLNLGAR